MANSNIFDMIKEDNHLHPKYLILRDTKGHIPAKSMFLELFSRFKDIDGNFVEQFQTTGFDARTYELFLFAVFEECGFKIDRSHNRPDFILNRDEVTVCVEAVTANPSNPNGPYEHTPIDRTDDEVLRYIEQEVPIRMGSPLFSKLNKKYWELAHVKDTPLVLAIQDFHQDGALWHGSTGLINYLYGEAQNWYYDKNGKLIISAEPINEHELEGGKKIPSGFFKQPNAEYISAVIFSNCGTVAKFNRMGISRDYSNPNIRMIRSGLCYRNDQNSSMPKPFSYEVTHGSSEESWSEGVELIHNPYAKNPLPCGFLGVPVEHVMDGGQRTTYSNSEFLPYASLTHVFTGADDSLIKECIEQNIEILSRRVPL